MRDAGYMQGFTVIAVEKCHEIQTQGPHLVNHPWVYLCLKKSIGSPGENESRKIDRKGINNDDFILQTSERDLRIYLYLLLLFNLQAAGKDLNYGALGKNSRHICIVVNVSSRPSYICHNHSLSYLC